MSHPSPSPGRARVRIPLTALIAVLMCALLLPWQASSAIAMTSTSASGYPGDVVTVTVGNQQSQRNATWVIDAPVGTTFAGVPTSSNPPGTGQFSCPLASPTRALCGPSPLWTSGNRVTMQLLIGENSRAGLTLGRTTLGSEGADIPVAVLAPPPPPVSDPAPDAVTLDRTPAVTGTKRAGNAVAVTFADGQDCSVPADSATTWTCSPPAPLAFGATTISAQQSSPADDVSPPTDRSFTVVDELAITTPLDGDRTTSRSVTIAGGGALAGADVTVSVAGQSFTAVADGSGRWTVLATDLPIGAHPVTASWRVSGRTLTAKLTTSSTSSSAAPSKPGIGRR